MWRTRKLHYWKSLFLSLGKCPNDTLEDVSVGINVGFQGQQNALGCQRIKADICTLFLRKFLHLEAVCHWGLHAGTSACSCGSRLAEATRMGSLCPVLRFCRLSHLVFNQFISCAPLDPFLSQRRKLGCCKVKIALGVRGGDETGLQAVWVQSPRWWLFRRLFQIRPGMAATTRCSSKAQLHVRVAFWCHFLLPQPQHLSPASLRFFLAPSSPYLYLCS